MSDSLSNAADPRIRSTATNDELCMEFTLHEFAAAASNSAEFTHSRGQ